MAKANPLRIAFQNKNVKLAVVRLSDDGSQPIRHISALKNNVLGVLLYLVFDLAYPQSLRFAFLRRTSEAPRAID